MPQSHEPIHVTAHRRALDPGRPSLAMLREVIDEFGAG